jgi:methionine sulfoxide reductase heme-binding subunit
MSVLLTNPLWFATRTCGTVALLLLSVGVVIGIGSAGRYAPNRLGRFEVAAVHRNISVLALAFLAAHILTAIADSYVPLGWAAVVIPFASPYRTLWVGLGTLAFDLLLAVTLTSAVRLRLGVRRWKAVHYLAYAAWPLAVFHSAGTGTDTRLNFQLALYVLCVGSVAAACWWRLYAAGPGRLGARMAAALAVGVFPVLLLVFLHGGPLAPGWSHRAQGPTAPGWGPAVTAAASLSRGAA